MATVLSVIGSAIALYQIADRVGQLLSKAKHLHQAPSELFALNNEISDLTIVLQNAEQCLSPNGTEDIILPESKIKHVCDMIDAAKKVLLELEQLIHHQFLKSGTLDGEFKVFRMCWARSRPIVENHRQNLQRIRQNIVMEMQVIGILHQARTRLVVDEINLISTQTQASQLHTYIQVEKILQEQAKHAVLLDTILDDHATLRRTIQGTTNAQQPSTSISESSIQSGFDIRAYVPVNWRRECGFQCKCRCHTKHSFKSAAFLRGLIGSLFIGYSGNPLNPASRCSIASCRGDVIFRARVHYYFPSWFLCKALEIEVISSISQEPRMSLVVRGIQLTTSKIYRLLIKDDVKGVQELFSRGLARPNDEFQNNRASLLDVAVNHGCINVVKALLNAGADAESPTSNNISAYWKAWRWISQARFDESILEAFRNYFPKKEDMKDEFHLSRLHRVILGFQDSRLEDELAAGGLELDATDAEGMTALAWACLRNDLPAIDILLKAKADPNVLNIRGSSVLHHAADNLNPVAVKLLLDAGADPRKADGNKQTALHITGTKYWRMVNHTAAARQALFEVVQILVEAGCDIEAPSVEGSTALGDSTVGDAVVPTEAFLDCGAEINVTDFDGDTPLMNAIHHDAYKTANLLLKRGADYTIVNNTGHTILHYASHSRDLRVLEVLIAANLSGINSNAVNDAGKTALQLAYEYEPKPDGFIEAFQALLFGIQNRNDRARSQSEGSGSNDAGDSEMMVPGAWPS